MVEIPKQIIFTASMDAPLDPDSVGAFFFL